MTGPLPVPTGGHAWAPLESEEEAAEVVGDFVLDGLHRGEAALLVGWRPQAAGLWRRLAADGVTGLAHGPGRTDAVRIVAPEPAEVQRSIEGALADGFPRIRLTRTLVSSELAQQYEPMVTDLIRRQPVAALCPYLRAQLLPGQEKRLRQTHSVELVTAADYDDGIFRLTRADGRLRLFGELDVTNTEALLALVRARLVQDDASVILDVAGLRFLDVGAAEILLSVVAGVSGLTLLHPSTLVERLLRTIATHYCGTEVHICRGRATS